MIKNLFVFLLVIYFNVLFANTVTKNSLQDKVINSVKKSVIERAKSFLSEKPVTVTSAHCERSAGGLNDFYSEGDYWWPDPQNPDGPYIQKDGQSNPDNFSEHRFAMIRLSEITATLTSAWLLTGDQKYADKTLEHLNAWFVNPATMMNPNMLYAQAIKGRFTGRSIGLIDAYHLVEVAQSVKMLSDKGGISVVAAAKIKDWFVKFLTWMTTHEYGIKEMNAENNHGTCWVATASAFATLTENQKIIDFCTNRFKTVLLPDQMAADGSFPREINRTKPYGYSLFNMDAFANVARILSTPENNLWEFSTPTGRSLKKGMEFIYPFIADKNKWPFAKDIYIWEEWPERQSCLLFAGMAYNNEDYIGLYLKLPANPTHPEVIRNLPVRHPVIWIFEAQNNHPHLLVGHEDKPGILKKIDQQPWAKSIFDEIQNEVRPYIERHQTDPQWILSRYLMNRVPGKRYTTVYSDESGQRLVKWTGDAPVPTVRVNTYLRSPITEKGTSYRKPTIEELVPNDTAKLMSLFNPETNQEEWVDPQAYITGINGDINNLALDAAILYWLTDEDKYAKFAADLLDQWAKGAYYQEPIIGPCRTGFLDMQTLGDGAHRSMILAYDFLKPFMQKKNYDLHWYETVFEKFASTLAFRGFWNNNWYAAESSTLVFAALSLEKKQKQDYYLQFFLEKDTINGGCGQLALPSTVEKWLTPDGHWKEPGGYHNYPVGNLLMASLALEKNGFDVFRKFPALLRASYAMLKYSFPNLTVGAFGDTGRASQSAESLEIGLIGAVKYNQPELPEMLASMKKLIDSGMYKRESSGFMGLLCFLPDIPEAKISYHWPRTGTLEFARLFLQRNGTNPQTGLMVGVQGATYNHNHCNGMSVELYGLGEVMGIDAGTGPNYEHPLHRNYYSQWAAHNTVVAAGSSSSVPFSGSAGSKNIGQIELAAMEPMPDDDAVSPDFSFTDTRYLDKSTNTNQSRTLAIVRTSETSGYYVDIYRSDNAISNDYVYHNIGEQVTFLNSKRVTLKTVESNYPVTEKDFPGFRFYTEVEKLEGFSDNLIALFSIKDEQSNDLFMQVLVPGTKGRTYYRAKSLKTKTAGKQYNGKPVPVFTMRTETEARTKPFIAVFEPYKGINGNSVDRISVEKGNYSGDFTALTVVNNDGTVQEIYQSVNPETLNITKSGSISGYFGISGFKNGKLNSLYLGKGTEITNSGFSLKSKEVNGSAHLVVDGKNFKISCNQETEIGLPVSGIKKAWLQQGSIRNELKIIMIKKGILVTVPMVKNGMLVME